MRARARRSSWVTTQTIGTPAAAAARRSRTKESLTAARSCLGRHAQDLFEARRALRELLDGRFAQRHQAIVARLLHDLLGARLGDDELADLVVDLEHLEDAGAPEQARRPALHAPLAERHHQLRTLPLGAQLVDVEPQERH